MFYILLKGGEKIYMQKCEDMIRENGSRIIVNLNELRKKLPQRVNGSLFWFKYNFKRPEPWIVFKY